MGANDEKSSRIEELEVILWGFIRELDRVRHLKRRPALERMLRVSHAISQLSAAYLKVVEAEAVMGAVPTLEAQVQELIRESHNGHRPPQTVTDRN